ncbi:unnamed protein product [Brassica rapa subsp. trilocularis]
MGGYELFGLFLTYGFTEVQLIYRQSYSVLSLLLRTRNIQWLFSVMRSSVILLDVKAFSCGG